MASCLSFQTGFSRECGTGMYKVLLFKCVFVPIASLLFAPLYRFRKSFLKWVTLSDHCDFSPFLHQLSSLALNVLIMWEKQRTSKEKATVILLFSVIINGNHLRSPLLSDLTNVTRQISTLHELQRFTTPV